MNRKIGIAIAVAIMATAAGCNDLQREPTPVAPPSSASEATASTPFYYHAGQPVYLEEDPQHMVVGTTAPAPLDVARQVLASLGVNVNDAGRIPQMEGHWRLHLAGAPPGAAMRAAAALRADRRFVFASPEYRTREGKHLVRLVNRIDVQFRDGVAAAQVDSLIQAMGMRLVRPPRPDSGFFAHRLAYPMGAEPLTVSHTLDRHPLVKWAAPDMILAYSPGA